MPDDDVKSERILGDFRIVRRIGRGGMGRVYLATQLSLDREVALKVLPREFSQDSRALKRFDREARTLAKLEHPNIVKVIQAGTDKGRYYLAMDYVEGETLKQAVERDGPMPVAKALSVVQQIAAALECAHQAKIIHRDIKPANIMLCSGDSVKVLDFGLAKVVGGVTTELTREGMQLGTPKYMSPEQWRGEPVTEQSDIFSLGMVLYYILTGEVPFEADTPHALMTQVLTRDVTAPSLITSGISGSVDRLVLDMTARETTHRYREVSAVTAEIARISLGDADSPARSRVPIERPGDQALKNLSTPGSLDEIESVDLALKAGGVYSDLSQPPPLPRYRVSRGSTPTERRRRNAHVTWQFFHLVVFFSTPIIIYKNIMYESEKGLPPLSVPDTLEILHVYSIILHYTALVLWLWVFFGLLSRAFSDRVHALGWFMLGLFALTFVQYLIVFMYDIDEVSWGWQDLNPYSLVILGIGISDLLHRSVLERFPS